MFRVIYETHLSTDPVMEYPTFGTETRAERWAFASLGRETGQGIITVTRVLSPLGEILNEFEA